MIDTPNSREMIGPVQIQQILRDIEWLKDLARAHTPRPTPTVYPNVTSMGTYYEARVAAITAATGGIATQMLVKAVHRDHLECKKVVVTQGVRYEEGEIIRVAKPDELRATGWDTAHLIGDPVLNGIDGYVYTYHPVPEGETANPDGSQNPYNTRQRELMDASEHDTASITWSEEIVPNYIPSYSVILAIKTDRNPLFQVTETVAEVATTYSIEWIDMNLAGRLWLEIPKKVKVCTGADNTDWFALLRTSDNFRES